MISLYSRKSLRKENKVECLGVELRGLSTDTKPTTIGNSKIDNGSIFIEIDTGKIFMYDFENEEWKEI